MEFLSNNALYVVLIIALMVFGGVGIILVSLERRLSKLQAKVEREFSEKG